MRHVGFCERAFFPMSLLLMVFSSGCIATQDWVNEKIFPVEKRVSETEAGLTKTNSRVSGLEGQMQTMAGQIAAMDSRLNQTNAKADRALENLQQLKIDRKLVLDMKDGAFFTSNSTVLTSRAKKEIDSFLSDVVGQAAGTGNLLFVVTGHTDNTGTEKYNYQLARIRADNTAVYLSAQKKVDPGQLVVMSYGETVPVGDNRTEAGRAKNRRVEILVYRDAIGVGQAAGTAAAR
jgi:outer membrane protein OmpA-like peptidoglycan-associated protein